VLKRQLEAERQSEATDAEALAAAVELSESAFSRSRQAQMDDMTRLADLRGAALVSATRRLQTESNLMALERRRTEVAREAEELEDALRVRWLSELREAEQSRAVNRARIDSVIERLAAAGLAAGGQRGAAAPELTLVRDGRTMPVADDVRLQPGDLLEVRWRTSTGADPATTDARSLHWPAVAVR
jgi:polysaccharide export outer membrane protein